MTEYTSSSEAVRHWNDSRTRTANWVSGLDLSQFESPSIARQDLDDEENGLSEPSDAESSHSLPPRMVLRYGPGRPDVPIPHATDRQEMRHLPYHGGMHPQEPLSSTPEEIRVLPSRQQIASQHVRSRSLPRNAFSPSHDHDMPPMPSSRIISQPLYPHSAAAPPMPPQRIPTAPPGGFPQAAIGHPPWHNIPPRTTAAPPHSPKGGHHHAPPAIVYAPAHHSSRPNYRPPAIYAYPPNIGPDGMIYSHSAPVPGQQYPQYAPHSTGMNSLSYQAGTMRNNATVSPSSASGHRHDRHSSRSGREKRSKSAPRSSGGRSRSRSIKLSAGKTSPTLSPSDDMHSDDSGSTYYVVPNNGRQKVLVLREQEMTPWPSSAAKSTETSPVSPSSSRSIKPWLQRLFHHGSRLSFSSGASAKSVQGSQNTERLGRRHSIGASGRPEVTPASVNGRSVAGSVRTRH